MEEKLLMSIEDTAKYLDISTTYLRSLVRANLIPFIKLGNRIKFNKESINVWVKEKEQKEIDNLNDFLKYII